MLELSIPFLASVVITILLRRLDKSNINLRKLKTLIERGQKELIDIALQKKEELKDAGTQLDLLLINSDKYLGELKNELSQLKESVADVQNSRNTLQEMDGELQSLELTTNSVKDQVKYINESLDKIDQHQKKIKNLQEYIKNVDQDASKMVKTFQKAIGEKSEEVVRLLEEKLSSVSSETHEYQKKLRDELLDKHGILSQKITDSYKELENSLRTSAKSLTSTIEKEVHSRFSILDELDIRIGENEKLLSVHLPDVIEQLKYKFQNELLDSQNQLETLNKSIARTDEDLRKRFEKIRTEMDEERNALFQNFIVETDKIRDQIHSLDYDTLAKKDELIRSVKEEASKIQGQINSFEKIYDVARENIFKQVNSQEEELAKHLARLQIAVSSSLETVSQESEKKRTEIELYLAEVFQRSEDQMSVFVKAIDNKSTLLFDSIQKIETKEDDRFRKFESFVNKAVEQVEELSREKQLELDDKIVLFEKTARKEEVEIEKRILKLERLVESSVKLIETRAAEKEDELLGFVDNEFDKVKTKIDYFHELFNENSGTLTSRVKENEDHLIRVMDEYKNAAQQSIYEMNSQLNREREKLAGFVSEQIAAVKSKLETFEKIYQTGIQDIGSETSKGRQFFTEQMKHFESGVQNSLTLLYTEADSRKQHVVEFLTRQFQEMETRFHELNKMFLDSAEEIGANLGGQEEVVKGMLEKVSVFMEEHSSDLASDAQRQKIEFENFVNSEITSLEEKFAAYRNTYAESIRNLEETGAKRDREIDSKLSHVQGVVDSAVDIIHSEAAKVKTEISGYTQQHLARFDEKIEKFKLLYEEKAEGVKGSLKAHEGELNEMVQSFRGVVEASMQQIVDEAETRKDEIHGYSAEQFNILQNKIELFNKMIEEGAITIDESVQSSDHAISEQVAAIEDAIVKAMASIQKETESGKTQVARVIDEEITGLQGRIDEFDRQYKNAQQFVAGKDREREERINDLVRGLKEAMSSSVREIHLESQKKRDEIEGFAKTEIANINGKIGELNLFFKQALDQIRVKTGEGEQVLEETKNSVEKSIRQAVDRVFDESENRKVEFIKSAEEELLKFQSKMDSFQEIYNESIESMHEKSAIAAGEVNELIAGLNLAVEGALSKIEDLSADEMRELQNQINQAITSVQGRAEEVFRESYEEFVADVKEYRDEFTRVQEQIQTLESISQERYEKLEGDMAAVKNQIQEELSGYVRQMKQSAKEMTENFEKDLGGKLVNVAKEIEGLESEIAQLRENSASELEGRVSPLYTKLGNIEKNLLDSQKHLMDKWNEETSAVMKKIQEKEILFSQSAEKWESQFENMTRTARDSVHKGFLELEKKRTDLLEGFDSTINEKVSEIEKVSQGWTEENEKNLSELMSAFKLKMQDKEDSAFEKMQQMSSRFTEIKKEIQGKHDSVLEILQGERSKLEKEMKQIGEKQLQLFNMEMDNKVEKTVETMQANSESMLQKIEKEVSNLRSEFKEVEESTKEMILSFTHEKKELFGKIDRETKQTAKEIMTVQGAFNQLKDEMKALEKAEKSTENVRKIIQMLEDKLQAAEEKNADIQEIYKRVDELKEVRLKLDAELMMLAQKREKVDKLEDQLQLILNIRDEIEDKGEKIAQIKGKVDDILGAQEQVDAYRGKLDTILEEFVQQHTLVESVLHTISDHQKSVDSVDDKIEVITNSFKMIDDRSRALKGQMDSMEMKMESLKKHESEIEDVQKKFLEIEDLIEDIEGRKKQIDTLRKRFEELRISMSDSVMSIEKIEHDAEAKVKQLTDLINASDYSERITSTPAVPGRGGERGSEKISGKSISSDKRKMIVRLGEMGWSADEIASKISIDVNSIETILSTFARQ